MLPTSNSLPFAPNLSISTNAVRVPPVNLPAEKSHTPLENDENSLEIPIKNQRKVWKGSFKDKDFEKLDKFEEQESKNKVYKCFHSPSNQNLVLKTVEVNFDDEKQISRNAISREIKILKKLKENPSFSNIITFYGCGITMDQKYFICMEVMHGNLTSLKLGLSGKNNNIHLIGYINFTVLKALKYLHSQDILHRDVKPSNILFNKNENKIIVKLTDFGISRFLLDKASFTVGNGTFKYMAPERIDNAPDSWVDLGRKKRSYGIETDIWSLAMTILELVLDEYPLIKRLETEKDIKKVLQSYNDKAFDIVEENDSRIKGNVDLIDYLKSCLCPSNARISGYEKLQEKDYVNKFEKTAGKSYLKETAELLI